MENHFLAPRSVAVIGASANEEKMGHLIFRNLIEGGLEGDIYPINPKQEPVLGRSSYPDVTALPQVPDLVVVTTPAKTIPDIVSECAKAGVPAMIIISAGFREIGEEGIALEREIMARKGKMRIAGPNCLGFMSPISGLNATFATGMAKKGNIGVISQSGAMLTALLSWADANDIGFSQYISLGIMLDYSWKDALYTLGADPKTKSILVYMESVGDYPREFLSAAREISAIKPIIIMKPGRSEDAARAAASHTGAITGSDTVLDAVFERAGIVRVDSISEFFGMAELARMTPPTGDGLTIITNAGGPGVIAVDALAKTAGTLAPISKQMEEALNEKLPFTWSHQNPIDIIGDATPERYREALEVVLNDRSTNAVLVILSPQVMTDPVGVARAVVEAKEKAQVPIFVSWIGGGELVDRARALFTEANIPHFDVPDAACVMFGHVVERMIRQKMLYQMTTDATKEHMIAPMQREIGRLLQRKQRDQEVILTEKEAKSVLRSYDIPTPKILMAHSPNEAVECAEELEYPVVLKLHSHTITHKSDVGGVHLNLRTAKEVLHAHQSIKERAGDGFEGVTVQPFVDEKGVELLIGSTTDPQLGPVITFGMGGTYVEVLADVATTLPPLNRILARRLIDRTKVSRILEGYRGAAPVDIDKLEGILISFARLITEHAEAIKEIDINPILATPKGMVALDARVVLHGRHNPVAPPAIRPYPINWAHDAHTHEGILFTIRPIRPDDEERISVFHERLSDESVQTRYQQMVPLAERQRHERLGPRCNIDYDRHMALVAILGGEIVGVVRLIKSGDGSTAEYSLVVLDEFQNKGIGSVLTKDILQWAEFEGMRRVEAMTTPGNNHMKHLLVRFSFKLTNNLEDGVVEGRLSFH